VFFIATAGEDIMSPVSAPKLGFDASTLGSRRREPGIPAKPRVRHGRGVV